MKKYLIILSAVVLFTACKKDKDDVTTPDDPNDQELITTLKLVITNQADAMDVREVVFKDTDGAGGNAPSVFDDLVLDANTNYDVQVYLIDESKNPDDTISYEVLEEAEEHQFFYEVSDANLTVNYVAGDEDENGVPVGLTPEFVTGAVSTGTLKVILKHQPNVKPTTGSGNVSLGDTDIEVTFEVEVQ